MYSEHLTAETPPDDSVLWRYMDLTKLISILSRGALYFSRVDRLQDDPWEGTLPPAQYQRRVDQSESALRKSIEHFESLHQEALDKGKDDSARYLEDIASFYRGQEPTASIDFYRFQRELAAVNCWTESPHESAALWKLYMASGDGVAITTTCSRLKNAFARTETTIFIGRIRYLDYSKDSIQDDNALWALWCKRISFEFEREVRVLAWRGGEAESRGRSPWGQNGGYIPVDVSRVIQSIHVSPTSSSWFRELVEDVVQRFDANYPVVQSSLAESPVF